MNRATSDRDPLTKALHRHQKEEEEKGEEEVGEGEEADDTGGGAGIRFRKLQRTPHLLEKATGMDTDKRMMDATKSSDSASSFSSDARCGCCPYGYHIDIDFLRYLSSLTNGELSQEDRKKMLLNKKKLRKSMEFFLHQQEVSKTSSSLDNPNPVSYSTSGPVLASSVSSDETKTNDELDKMDKLDTEELMEQFDRTIDAQLASMVRSVSSDSSRTEDKSRSDVEKRKFRTETEFMLSQATKSPANVITEYDSCSSMSMSSGPSSPSCQFSPRLDASRMAKAADSKHETSSFFARSVHSTSPHHLPETSFKRPTASKDEVTCQAQLSPHHPVESSSNMTQISASTLQAIREQMAISLERMKQLEEQVKAIPVLQVRLSILKEEKKQLMEQMKSNSTNSEGIDVVENGSSPKNTEGREKTLVTNGLVEWDGNSDLLYGPVKKKKKSRSIGVGDGNVFSASGPPPASSSSSSGGVGVDGEMVKLFEKAMASECISELHERELKTVFFGDSSSSSSNSISSDLTSTSAKTKDKPKIPPKPKLKPKTVTATTDSTASSVAEIHDRELRTVFIETAAEKETKSVRNVGIHCRAATRDVGVMHMNENERPMTRSIGIGVGEMGVSHVRSNLQQQQPEDAQFQSSVQAFQTCHMFSVAEARRIHIRDDQLRSVLDEMLRKTVHSVGVQCRFSTTDKGVDAMVPVDVGPNVVDIGCGVDTVDVDVLPKRQMKSVAVDNRPSLSHKLSCTDPVYKVDSSTSTLTFQQRMDSSTNTVHIESSSAATSTDPPLCEHSSVSTEVDAALLRINVCDFGMNTDAIQTFSVSTWTPSVGESQEDKSSAIKQCNEAGNNSSKEQITTTKVIRTCTEKATETVTSSLTDRSCNTDYNNCKIASTNTDKMVLVSRAVGNSGSIFGDDGSRRNDTCVDNVDGICDTFNVGNICDEVVPITRKLDAKKEVRSELAPGDENCLSLSDTDIGVTPAMDDFGPRSQHAYLSLQENRTTSRDVTSSTVSPPSPLTQVNCQQEEEEEDPSWSKRLLSASDDSVSTQCSVIERYALPSNRNSSVDYADDTTERDLIDLTGTEILRDECTNSSSTSNKISESVGRNVKENGKVAPESTERDGQSMTSTGQTSDLDLLMDHLEMNVELSPNPAAQSEPSRRHRDGKSWTENRASPQVAFRGRKTDTASSYDDEDDDVIDWQTRTSVFGSEAENRFCSAVDDGFLESTAAGHRSGQGVRVVVTDSRTERRRCGPGEEGKENNKRKEEEEQSSRSVPLRSIMKPSSAMGGNGGAGGGGNNGTKRRKELTFSEGITVDRYFPEDEEPDDSDSDGSRSSQSFDEGSYDSQLGQVIYTCRDDEDGLDGDDDDDDDDDDEKDDADAVFDHGGFTFADQNVRHTYELSEEMVSACTTYASWLETAEDVSEEELSSSLAIIQSEWFSSTSQKLADPLQVEDYLTQTNEISHKLLEHIVNMTDSNGNTALHYAISHCNIEVVNMILDTGVCDVDQRNRAGYNAIMLASLSDIQTERQRDVIRRLFSMGDVNERALQAGQTALMLAVSHGDASVVRMLLEAGAKVNLQDEDGSTALMCASEHGHLEIVKLLLAQEECDASLVDSDGSTAVSIAMEAGHREVGILLYAHLNFKPSSPIACQRKIKRKTFSSHSSMKK